ncbi:protein BIG GRAIN 1-like [Zingiber officinale]|uniref:protein BIG GRAIN 1-like n=1 Tax=Zingiber officinale TaxID=94328 RepID=UPI001C4BC757|nr:protein BIG GRAIN 1-like [Zingiber officinale]
MERLEKERVRRRHECPSFSSSLLDVIYRSIDDSDKGGAVQAAAARERVFVSPSSLPPISSSSSSDNSSCSGFSSSSEPDSAASRRPQIRPIRTAPPPCRSSSAHPPTLQTTKQAASLPANNHHERTESTSIRSRLRDLGRRSKAPESPGSRLAVLLNSLFANAAGRRRKSKPPPTAADGFPWSAPVAHSRPCLVKTPSSRRAAASEEEGAKRSVRFHPASVVMEVDRLPQGQKTMCHGNPSEAAADEGKGRKEARQKLEDILRRFEAEEEAEEEDEMSDSSSDLFELDNLAFKAGGGGGYRDELPVYETTHRGTNCAISRTLAHQHLSK